jgi:hypothetical protein
LHEVTFEGGSRLRRIEKYASSETGVKAIRIPSNVEFIGEECCWMCESLREVTFGGETKEIGKDAFQECPLRRAMIPHGAKLNYEFPYGCIIESFDPAAL